MAEMAIQVDIERKELENARTIITLKQKEQEFKDNDIIKQTQELDASHRILQEEREVLEIMKKDLNVQQEEIQSTVKTIEEEKDELQVLKADIDTERGILLAQREKMETKVSEVTIREEVLMKTMKTIEHQRTKLRELDDRSRADIGSKMKSLEEKNMNVQKLSKIFREKYDKLDKQKERMDVYSELIQKERENFCRTRSDVINQREEIQNEWKEMLSAENQNLKEEIQRKRDELNKLKEMITKDKVDLVILRGETQKQTDILERQKHDLIEERVRLDKAKIEIKHKQENIDTVWEEIDGEKKKIDEMAIHLEKERKELDNARTIVTLKWKEQELKENDIIKQTQELTISLRILQEEREVLEIMKKELNLQQEEIQSTVNTIEEEKDELSVLKSDIDMDISILVQREKIKTDVSEIRIRDEELIRTMETVEHQITTLKDLHGRTRADIRRKIKNLEEKNMNIQKLSQILKEKYDDVDEQKEKMEAYSALIQKERENLIRTRSELIHQREETQNEWKQKLAVEKQNHKEEIQREREEINKVMEIITKDKLDLEVLRADTQTQIDTLEREKHNVMEEQTRLEKSKIKTKHEQENIDAVLEEIDGEKNMAEMAVQVDMERKDLENASTIITLKQKEQELKDNDIIKQTQELDASRCILQEEREVFEIMKKAQNENDIIKRTQELELESERFRSLFEQAMKITDRLKDQIKVEKQEKVQLIGTMLKIQYTLEQMKLENERQIQEIYKIKRKTVLDLRGKYEMEKIKFEAKKKVTVSEHLDMDVEENIDKIKHKLKQMCVEMQEQKQDIEGKLYELSVKKKETEITLTTIKRQWEELQHQNTEDGQDKQKIQRLLNNISSQIKEIQKEREEIQSKIINMNTERASIEQIETDLQRQSETLYHLVAVTKLEKQKIEKLAIQNMRKKVETERFREYIKKKTDDLELVKTDIDTKINKLEKIQMALRTHCENITHLMLDVKKETENTKQKIFQIQAHLTKEKIRHQGQKPHFVKWRQTELETVAQRQDEDSSKYTDTVNVEHMETAEKTDFTEEMLKKEQLRKIWKKTRVQRVEIDQMKRRGYDMRKNLEKRLTVIREVVKKTLLQREREPSEKMTAELEQESQISQREEERNRKMLHDKYKDLELLKMQFLTEIKKICFMEKEPKTVKTSDKAMQTTPLDETTTGLMSQEWKGTALQITSEETTSWMLSESFGSSTQELLEPGEGQTAQGVQVAGEAPESSSGVLSQLWHYCYRCCCCCYCDCCREVCQEETETV
ncbi:trichohyalin-like [Lampris incognitus]|uniref:trichohyalin-like n=1 Tax=Lampris incognitus TaxID=2546036 RepID=UPI0024B4B403|nr:trichohyalin-like [Lampris incognitus]